MNEPILTNPPGPSGGNQSIAEEQYIRWLEDMSPFLRSGNTLWYSMDKCLLLQHKTAIYAKYRLNDWFAEKIDALRATVGEMINAVGFKVIEGIHTRMIETGGKTQLSSEEVRIWQTMAEKHRSAQPFFVNRTETAPADDNKVGKILDSLELQSRYDDLGTEIIEQMSKTQTEPLPAPSSPLQP